MLGSLPDDRGATERSVSNSSRGYWSIGAHAVAVEEGREDALQRLAALEHVAHARRGAQVVLEHEVAAVAVADQVDAADVGVDVARDVEPRSSRA